jgi:hypothetical protein
VCKLAPRRCQIRHATAEGPAIGGLRTRTAPVVPRPRDPPHARRRPARRYPLSAVNRRPKLSIVAPGASPEEAAAVIAAVEQFIRATAPPVVEPAPAAIGAWRRAALLEGVSRSPGEPPPWSPA